MKALDVNNLIVKYKNFTAVDGISFSVEKGEIFGIIGPNGAGKTSTMECIEGFRKRSGGEVKILDVLMTDRVSLYKKIGIQLQETKLQDNLKVIELIQLYSSFYDESADADELLKLFGIESSRDKFVKKLSGGQKQRLAIILALVGKPQILFLDEISTGLDPQGRIQIWDIINKLKLSGTTIIMTTHFMEEAEMLCDRVCCMAGGKIKAIGSINELIEKADMPIKITLTFSGGAPEFDKTYTAEKEGNVITVSVKAAENIGQAIKYFSSLADISDIDIHKPGLEDVFLELTGEKLKAESI